MDVLKFVEGSEYRKERARQMAKALVADLGLDGVLDTPAVADGLLAALGEDLAVLARQALRDAVSHAISDGFDEIAASDAEATMSRAVARVLTASRAALSARLDTLEGTIAAMQAGSSAEAVQAALGSQAVRDGLLSPVASVLAQAGAGVIQAVEADIRNEAVAAHRERVDAEAAAAGEEPPPDLYEWQTREDDNVCGEGDIIEVSCAARHGKQLTWEEWQLFGLPGDADSPTICAVFAGSGQSRCRCGLIPAGSAASTSTPVKIADAIKAGKDRAKEAA